MSRVFYMFRASVYRIRQRCDDALIPTTVKKKKFIYDLQMFILPQNNIMNLRFVISSKNVYRTCKIANMWYNVDVY